MTPAGDRKARSFRTGLRLRASGVILAVSLFAIQGCGGDGDVKPATQGPSVTVRAPNGEESYMISISYPIDWSATDPDTPSSSLTISIDYTRDGGNTWAVIATGQPNQPPYYWPPPSPTSSLCKIRVTASDGTNSGSDISDDFFTIVTQPEQESAVSIGSAAGATRTQVSVELSLANQVVVSNLQTDIAFDSGVVEYVSGTVTERGTGMTYSGLLLEGKLHVDLSYAGTTTLPVGSGALVDVTFSLIGAGGSQTEMMPTETVVLDGWGGSLPVRNEAGVITVMEAVPTAEELTARGWVKFEVGNFDGALEEFDAAIAFDETYGPAYVGQGWARLSLATTSSAYNEAVASFDLAVGLGQTGAEVTSGRAAGYLAISEHASAITDAQAAQGDAPDFVFSHRAGFDINDLHLIEAFANAGEADLSDALTAADAVSTSGIDAGNSATWVVDGITYPTFESAVLAFLHKLSAEAAG